MLLDKRIGLYFAAEWCDCCASYTPLLIKKYLEIIDKGYNFEIISIPLDKEKESAVRYYGSMPWLMLSYDDRISNDKLCDQYNVSDMQ
jgi:hypothetical protein